MENWLEYRNRYKLQRCVCIFVPCRQFILSHPVYRVSPERTKCIVENFTGQYRLDGLTLSFAQQRFPFPSRCISPLRAYVYQNLSEPFTSQWHNRQSCTDYLLRADLAKNDIIFWSAKISTWDIQDPIIMLPSLYFIPSRNVYHTSLEIHQFAVLCGICNKNFTYI